MLFSCSASQNVHFPVYSLQPKPVLFSQTCSIPAVRKTYIFGRWKPNKYTISITRLPDEVQSCGAFPPLVIRDYYLIPCYDLCDRSWSGIFHNGHFQIKRCPKFFPGLCTRIGFGSGFRRKVLMCSDKCRTGSRNRDAPFPAPPQRLTSSGHGVTLSPIKEVGPCTAFFWWRMTR